MHPETGCYQRIVSEATIKCSGLKGILQELCQFWYSLHHSADCYLVGLLNLHTEWEKRDLR